VSIPITLEIAGYTESECSPFPCDEDRTCGLSACAPSGSLVKACAALKDEISKEFGDRVTMKLTFLDEKVPDHIKKIYEKDHPAIPMILLQGRVLPVGRISWPHIRDAINLELEKLSRS